MIFTVLSFLIVFYSFCKLEKETADEVHDRIIIFEGNDNGGNLVKNYRDKSRSKTLDNFKPLKDGDIQDPRLKSKEKYLVIILVHSAINQTSRREAIRHTWLSKTMTTLDTNSNNTLAYWFLIGTKDASRSDIDNLLKEQEAFGDLLIMNNVNNDYQSLPYRTLYSMVHMDKHYVFTYLLKTDDDVYINMPIVLQEMKELRPRERLYWGRFSCHNPPMEYGQWKEHRWHWCDVYYPYAYGGMYVLTYDVVTLVAENAPFLQLYSCEDVSLGMWLGAYNLVRINDIRIFVGHSLQCSRGFIAIHIPSVQVPKIIRKTHENLKRKGVICTTLVYEDLFSWRELPQKCKTEEVMVI